ncbi:hypothetical protein HU200_000288 [Digitaria exilis]|uniref:Uncharacterized protein n=1 Tax=Digitaria exilis TaxID=1010633 RepID=A0A835G332_9POAL|nr:hypothetical protein HU200_000288 [Digitaria exilis]
MTAALHVDVVGISKASAFAGEEPTPWIRQTSRAAGRDERALGDARAASNPPPLLRRHVPGGVGHVHNEEDAKAGRPGDGSYLVMDAVERHRSRGMRLRGKPGAECGRPNQHVQAPHVRSTTPARRSPPPLVFECSRFSPNSGGAFGATLPQPPTGAERGASDSARHPPQPPAAMKLTVKTLKGTHFEIRVQPNDTVRSLEAEAQINDAHWAAGSERSWPFRRR